MQVNKSHVRQHKFTNTQTDTHTHTCTNTHPRAAQQTSQIRTPSLNPCKRSAPTCHLNGISDPKVSQICLFSNLHLECTLLFHLPVRWALSCSLQDLDPRPYLLQLFSQPQLLLQGVVFLNNWAALVCPCLRPRAPENFLALTEVRCISGPISKLRKDFSR